MRDIIAREDPRASEESPTRWVDVSSGTRDADRPGHRSGHRLRVREHAGVLEARNQGRHEQGQSEHDA